MKKEFVRVAGITAGVILLLPFPFLGNSWRFNDYVLGVGVAALAIALIWLFIGLILVLIDSTRKTGQSFLLTAAILLLLSFTLCSTGGGLVG